MKHTAILSPLVFLLASCALLEPTASNSFNTAPGTSTETVLTCTETAISALRKENTKWQPKITSRNLQIGTLETNNFGEVNIAGIRAQVKYDQASSKGHIKIKASGPYFSDLGAEQAAKELKNYIIQCLAPN